MVLEALREEPRLAAGAARVACGDYHRFLRSSSLALHDDPRWLPGGELVLDEDYAAELREREPLRFAGTSEGLDGAVPNITPDAATGIGDWDAEDIAEYLDSGFSPDFDTVGGAMAAVVREGTSHLSDVDRAAIAEFLLALEPVQNEATSQE